MRLFEQTKHSFDRRGSRNRQLSSQTLRFNVASTEHAFISSRSEALTNAFRVGSLLASIVAGAFACWVLLEWQSSGLTFMAGSGTWRLAMMRNFQVLGTFLLSVVVQIAICCRCFRSMLGFLGFEIFVTALTSILIVLLFTANPWYLARLCGVDPMSAVGGNTVLNDAGLLLYVDGVITVVHLMLPVRWVVLWVAEATTVVSYAGFALLLGSPDPVSVVFMNILILTTLAVAAGVGRRQLELQERVSFLKVLDEKTQRIRLEHRLEGFQRQASGNPPPMNDAASDTATGITGDMFQALESCGSGEEKKECLQEIAQLGSDEHWLIPASDVQALPGLLGTGGFGMVMRARYHGAVVALKASRVEGMGCLGSSRSFTALAQELRIFRRLHHPNVVQFIGACILPQSGELLLVLEFVHGAPLSDYIAPPPSDPPTSERFALAGGVACALMYLHRQQPQIVHGDIKSANVLVQRQGEGAVAKLTDFGLSRLITRNARLRGCSLEWAAPEVIIYRSSSKERSLEPKADTFSFGRLLYMIMVGRAPLQDVSHEDILQAVRQGTPHSVTWPDHIPMVMELKKLGDACTQLEESQRPDMEYVEAALRSAADSSQNCVGLAAKFSASLHSTIMVARASLPERYDMMSSHSSLAVNALSPENDLSLTSVVPGGPRDQPVGATVIGHPRT